MSRLDDVRQLYREAKVAYYYGDAPIMGDQEFDLLEKELRELSPGDELLGTVGADIDRSNMLEKANHEIPMTSLSNSRNAAEFMAWHAGSGSGEAILASEKRDGASVEVKYEDGILKQAITRGDGLIGEDITANAIQFQNLPAMLPTSFTGSVRGEVQYSTKNWQNLANPGPNPRNTGNGAMRRKNSTNGEEKLLEFFAFDIVGDINVSTEVEKLELLEEMGLSVVPWKLCNTTQDAIDWYHKKLADRDTLKYWIDGIVMKINDLAVQHALGVSGGRPKGQTAFKFPFVGVETTIIGMAISVGHTGMITPTAKLDPVMIGGTMVKSANLNNWGEIKRLNVAIGDTVLVEKAGDIIPKIMGVVKRPDARTLVPEPATCPVCGSPTGKETILGGLDGIRTMCMGTDCPVKTVGGKIKNWVNKINILGIGDARRDAMIAHLGVKTISDLYQIQPGELARCILGNGQEIGDKVAQAICDNISSRSDLTIDEFLGSLGIRYLGRSRVAHIRTDVPGEFDTLDDWLDSDKVRRLAAQAHIPGMVEDIIAGIEENKGLIDGLIGNNFICIIGDEVAPLPTDGGPLSGEVLVFTGKIEKVDEGGKRFTRSMMEEVACSAGAGTESKIRSSVTMLVQADPSSSSSKTVKAQKQGCKIISEADFWEMVS